jgi:hypothetical protein
VRGVSLRAAPAPTGNFWRGLFQNPGVFLLWEPTPLRGALLRWAKAAHDHRLLSRYQTGQAPPQATASADAIRPDQAG